MVLSEKVAGYNDSLKEMVIEEDESLEAAPQKIGVTLSGGGAKGLAHIGILQAIDEAELEVDYLTGTSMGALIGGLYAAGYSADTIETMARQIDWDSYFRQQTTLDRVGMEEKDQFNRYAVELPLVDNRPQFPSGLVEGQQLSLTLSELFFPVFDKKDFRDFDIPFACVATDLASGEAVQLDSGEVSKAVRASISIPTVFSPVEIGGRTFIDGGVARNFPVRNAKEMGADFVIGSRVSTGLRDPEEIRNPIDIIYQMGFFQDAATFSEDLLLSDIYITPELEDFSPASFSDADEIIEAGQKEGKKWVDSFKAIADTQATQANPYDRLPPVNQVRLNEVVVSGLAREETIFFQNSLPFNEGDTVSIQEITEAIRNLYGMRRYERIDFKFLPLQWDEADLLFQVSRRPPASIQASLNYNSQAESSIMAGMTVNNLLLHNSLATFRVNIGSNQHWRIRYHKFSGMGRDYAITAFSNLESVDLPFYESANQSQEQEYRAFYMDGGLNAQYTPDRNEAWGTVTSFQWHNYSPQFQRGRPYPSGNLFNFDHHVFFKENTLDHHYFPTKGRKNELKTGLIHGFSASDEWEDSRPFTSLEGPFFYVDFSSQQMKQFSEKYFLTYKGNFYFLYGENPPLPFQKWLGGLNEIKKQQRPFSGLSLGRVSSSSTASIGLDLRREITNNVYGEAHLSGGVFDFRENTFNELNSDHIISGQALSISYNSRFGPIRFSLMHSLNTNNLTAYVNIGHHF